MYRHKTKIEIRFSDLDAFNHVNNACYLTYIEQARIAYFNDIVGWDYNWSKRGIILAKASVDFIYPIHINDRIEIYTRCNRMGNKSFDLQYRLVKIDNEKEVLIAEASTVMVAFDYTEQKSIEVPVEWKNLIHSYEAGTLK
ncbi:MAG TPA: thioesterase family protein [Bacteroidia bacterium]|nr:thioesterase family protein [Bacteroidia bacterium]